MTQTDLSKITKLLNQHASMQASLTDIGADAEVKQGATKTVAERIADVFIDAPKPTEPETWNAKKPYGFIVRAVGKGFDFQSVDFPGIYDNKKQAERLIRGLHHSLEGYEIKPVYL